MKPGSWSRGGLLPGTMPSLITCCELQQRMRELARPITVGLVAAIAIVSLWTPSAHAEIAARWFSLPNFLFFAPVPVLMHR